jgi:hypothetical protein
MSFIIILALMVIVFGAILFIGLSIKAPFDAVASQPEPLQSVAQTLGLVRDRKGVYRGEVNGYEVNFQRTRRNDKPGIAVTVVTNTLLRGEVKLSGPSANANSAQPEAKIRIGDGAFDSQFWVLREAPPGATADLLLPYDAVRNAMLEVPFGQWEMTDHLITYTSYRIPPDGYETIIPQIVSLLTHLAAAVEDADEMDSVGRQ